jgi:hypothetical protein
MSSVLLGGPPASGDLRPVSSATSPFAQGAPPADDAERSGIGRGNTVTVLAGVGVLLLAMGVGVLIGRSGSSKPVTTPAQVISVAQPGATTGAVTTPTKTPEASSKSGSRSSGHGSKKGASSVGSSPSNPAPPSVVQNLRKGGGQSYEQKSKNLPNVISTG